MGTLFCADKIHTLRPQWILEVGVDSNTFFDEHFGTQLEYWATDDTGFFSAEQLAKTQQRPHTRAL
jgi:hypothetical protein